MLKTESYGKADTQASRGKPQYSQINSIFHLWERVCELLVAPEDAAVPSMAGERGQWVADGVWLGGCLGMVHMAGSSFSLGLLHRSLPCNQWIIFPEQYNFSSPLFFPLDDSQRLHGSQG